MQKYEWQDQMNTAVTYTDSDWAGCTKTAKSTSGGIVTLGKHVIKSYSRQQKTVALSSAEAELHAMVAASAETIGVVGLCKDMGIGIEGRCTLIVMQPSESLNDPVRAKLDTSGYRPSGFKKLDALVD